ncbi:MAG: 3-methyl-2-oxobutanoate hydroxymethyltransferase, partial [Deefgea sp.]
MRQTIAANLIAWIPTMKTTLNTLLKMKQDGQKIAMLTCYDASFASLLDEAGVDIFLIGDSLGNVI